MNMTSNCDVANSAHQTKMTTICHWMNPPPWKFSAYTTAHVYKVKSSALLLWPSRVMLSSMSNFFFAIMPR